MRGDEKNRLTRIQQPARTLEIYYADPPAKLRRRQGGGLYDLHQHVGEAGVVVANGRTQPGLVKLWECAREIFANQLLTVRKETRRQPADKAREAVQQRKWKVRYESRPPDGTGGWCPVLMGVAIRVVGGALGPHLPLVYRMGLYWRRRCRRRR